MQKKAWLQFLSPWGKLFLLIGLILIFTIITAFGGLFIGEFWLDVGLMNLAQIISHPVSEEAINFTRFYQFLNQLGVFILPVLLYSFLISNKLSENLHLNKKPKGQSVVLSVALIFIVLPFLNYLTQWNMNINFPESLAGIENWMHEKEELAGMLTEAMLKGTSIYVLMANIIVVGLMAALGEELMFRGALLSIFEDIFKNEHAAVIITSIIFSAIHFQFFGFFPRLLMGLILGYLMVFTKNLWVPIIMHFINNSASVILYYLNNTDVTTTKSETFGSSDSYLIILGSLIVTLVVLGVIKYIEQSKELFHIKKEVNHND